MPYDPYAAIQTATRKHRSSHGCGAYTFEDGPGLTQLSAALHPLRILELGTGLGYTACCLAQGSLEAVVDTVEGDAEHVEIARKLIAEAGMTSRVQVHHGKFDQVVPRLRADYDLIFFDGFAPDETMMLLLRSRLAKGGTLVCANLGLAKDPVQTRLLQDFKNRDQWEQVSTLEGGHTLVLKKVD